MGAVVWLLYVNVKYHTIAGIILFFYCVIFIDMMIEAVSYNYIYIYINVFLMVR